MTATPDEKTLTGFISGERHVSLEAMADRSMRAARVLHQAGVAAGDAVAIMLRNDLAFLEATYGASHLGAIAVPINWHYGREEAGFIIDDARAKVLIVHADLLPQIDGAVPAAVEVLVVDTPREVAAAYGIDAAMTPADHRSWERALDSADPWTEDPRTAPPSTIYTSGTTGTPKAVRRAAPLDPSDPVVMASMGAIGVGPRMRTVVCGPMSHAAPNVFAMMAGRTGGLVILQPKFDPEDLLALVERHAVTALHLVPTMMIRLLRLPEATRALFDLSSLQKVAHAAAPCPPEVKRGCIEWLGSIICEYYGGTESGPVVACTSDEWLAHPGTVGRALPGSTVRILDQDGAELPTGQPGDIYVWNSGFGDFTYDGQPDARAEIERDGLITVGDIGYLDPDGYLYLCDRRKDMIISGGVNIYPAEIEAVLHAHPDVNDCAVFGIPDPEFGEAVAAVIEPIAGTVLDPEAIRAHLRERLAGFKVPREIEFDDDLPREDSGKIFKRKIRDRYWPAARSI